jgi:hypothetical protein
MCRLVKNTRSAHTQSLGPECSSSFLTPMHHFNHRIEQPRVAEYGWIVFGKINRHAQFATIRGIGRLVTANPSSAFDRRPWYPTLNDRLLRCADSGMHAPGPADNMVVVGGVCWLGIVAAPKNDPEWDALGLEERLKCPHVAIEIELSRMNLEIIDSHVQVVEGRLVSVLFERSSPLYAQMTDRSRRLLPPIPVPRWPYRVRIGVS